MKPFLCFLALLCACLSSLAQSSALEIGTPDSIQSTTLKEKRKLWIQLPEGYKDSTRDTRKMLCQLQPTTAR